jgi:hypothetical protein
VLGSIVFVVVAGVFAWLGAKDRRWLFLGLALYVVVPLLQPVGLPKVKITPEAQALYDFIEALPTDRVVLLTCDYDPGSKPELHPMTFAIVEHLCRRNIPFAVIELWPQGSGMANEVIDEVVEKKYGKQEYRDYVHLGFKSGQEVVIQSLGNSLLKTYPTDIKGVPIGEIPVLSGIESVKDFSLIMNISAGTPGTKEWVQQAGSRYGVPVATGCTGVQAPQSYPYYPRQLVGLLGGMAAAAEYERLVGVPGSATKGMEAQSFTHAVVFLFVVFGNVVYFWQRRRRGGEA